MTQVPPTRDTSATATRAPAAAATLAARIPPEPAPITKRRSEEHTSELQSLMRTSYAVFCLKKKKQTLFLTDTPPPSHTHPIHTLLLTLLTYIALSNLKISI